jgi:hypothetical protein
MKLLLLKTLISYTSFSQPDTLFLKRSIFQYGDSSFKYSIYHATYIDSDYGSTLKTVIDQYFNQIDSSSYQESLQQFHRKTFKKFPIIDQFPLRRVELFQYKNEYYTYDPSDFGNLYKFQITDSTTLDYYMDGPGISFIQKATIEKHKLDLTLQNYWQGRKMTINMIDTTRGIAIFTFSPTMYNSNIEKKLMVRTDKMHLFKTVVNYCPTDKMDEFEFDKIDFWQLEKNGRDHLPSLSNK